jgi:hypothetical protein
MYIYVLLCLHGFIHMYKYIFGLGGGCCAGRGHAFKNTDKGVGIGAKILTKLGDFKYKY